MVQHKPTPEEQLLKLIEGGSASSQGAAQRPAPKSVSGKSKNFAVLGRIPGIFEYARNFFPTRGASFSSTALFEVKNLNRLLVALVAAAGVFLAVDLIFFNPNQSTFLSQVSTSDAVYPVRAGSADKISSDISVYKMAAQKRNPFLPPQAVVLPGPADSGKTVSSGPVGGTGTISEALQAIKLVGISWSDNPLALIEDVSNGRTYFLRKGQEMKGIKIQDISKEKVMVTYQGQEGELF